MASGCRGTSRIRYVWQNPLGCQDPEGLTGNEIDLGHGWTARVDPIPTRPGGPFEYHVFNPKGVEVGIAGPDGWKARHGLSGTMPEGMPRDVVNRINGQAVSDARRIGAIPPKGKANIKGHIKRFLRPDKAGVVTSLVCLPTPGVCEGLDHAIECLIRGSRKPKCQSTEIMI